MNVARFFAVGRLQVGGWRENFAILRHANALNFTDGFERGTTAGWLGN